MAKGFSKNNPLDKLSGIDEPKNMNVQEVSAADEFKSQELATKQKGKAGRPKTKDVKNTCRNINVAIPITLLKKWDDIKIVHGNNLTEYISKLIEKDMDANYELYKNILNSLKNI